MDTVRDLDLLRYLLGDSKINYFGSSYGTRIGALYAELFPQRVGRMVLDGAVDINSKSKINQVDGFERALRHFASWCADEHCRIGAQRDEVLSKIKDFLDRLDQQPLAVDGGRTLSQQQGVEAVFYSMYGGRGSWPELRDALTTAIFDGDGAGLLALADASDRRDRDGTYGQLNYAFPAIRCLDSQDDSVRAAEKRLAEESRRAPILGRLNGPDLTCSLWPVKSAPKQPAVDGNGAPAIVVIGTTGDPATPYEYEVHGRPTQFGGARDIQWRRAPGVRAEQLRQVGGRCVPGSFSSSAGWDSVLISPFWTSSWVTPLDIVGDRAEPAGASHQPP